LYTKKKNLASYKINEDEVKSNKGNRAKTCDSISNCINSGSFFGYNFFKCRSKANDKWDEGKKDRYPKVNRTPEDIGQYKYDKQTKREKIQTVNNKERSWSIKANNKILF